MKRLFYLLLVWSGSGPRQPSRARTRTSCTGRRSRPAANPTSSARHQQVVLKKRCPAIDTIIQYKPGAGGGLMWAQMNQLPGRRREHRRHQPAAHRVPAARGPGPVQDRGRDAGVLVPLHAGCAGGSGSSPIKTFQDFVKAAKAEPEKITLGGSGLNSANHAAHERLNATFGVKTTYVPFKGTGDMTTAVHRRPRRRRDVVHRVRRQQQGQGARARRGDGQAPSAAPGRADVQGARRRLGRRRLSRHRRAEVVDRRSSASAWPNCGPRSTTTPR